ncbi:hypothetical protein B0H13DRAFT_2299929 [Mycena leptocephala]|nr:hypothetical protein B0H13DRAFT_2299929 [Mycena leptocephala]
MRTLRVRALVPAPGAVPAQARAPRHLGPQLALPVPNAQRAAPTAKLHDAAVLTLTATPAPPAAQMFEYALPVWYKPVSANSDERRLGTVWITKALRKVQRLVCKLITGPLSTLQFTALDNNLHKDFPVSQCNTQMLETQPKE